ncbi:NlpC/P60 family protein [Rossellomorea sp. BNER]|uniref:C40 family peptidase n=1 Tax=Rossellomorea sp. BNER TaxID=2962031 RepID=UPI003AF225AC|nr:C40 family peptidase [Rossellomorea sp. BNER]
MTIEKRWVVNVPVATVWTSFDSAREIDQDAITNPADVKAWLSQLTYETGLELCDDNLVQSQVLFGQEVLVIDEKDDWVQVIVLDQPSSKDERGYPGWIPKPQLSLQSDWTLRQGLVAVVTNKKAVLQNQGNESLMELSYQTILPVTGEQDNSIEVKTPIGPCFLKKDDVLVFSSIESIPNGNGEMIVSEGKQFLGLPYLWGGMSSYGFDCSGFSYTMCKANGVIIPRDASDQAKTGEPVDLSMIQPGDLLFFAYEEGKGRIHHVGICCGDGKMIHSPNVGKAIEIISLEGTVYEKELCVARRYWHETGE